MRFLVCQRFILALPRCRRTYHAFVDLSRRHPRQPTYIGLQPLFYVIFFVLLAAFIPFVISCSGRNFILRPTSHFPTILIPTSGHTLHNITASVTEL